MALFHNIPKGGKGIKYSGKKRPMVRADKYKRLIFVLIILIIAENGFTFDSQGFSLSEPAQINWVGLKTMEALLTFPINITTKDDNEYSLIQTNLDSFLSTAVGTKQAHLDSGRTFKVAISAATTQAELDAVVDNR